MKFKCTHCEQVIEADSDVAGQNVECPTCKNSFVVPAARVLPAAPAIPQATLTRLRDPKEGTAFAWLIFFSLLVWFFLVLWVLLTLGVAFIIIGMIVLFRFMAEVFASAYIKTNAVEVSERQFPEIHAIVTDFSRRLGKTPPTVYVMQQNIWNSFAMILAGKRLVVLLSGAIDSLLLKGSMTQLAWLVGHELGHHYSGQLNFWRRTTAAMGAWCIWVALWYSRRCELTCDRYGLACANSLSESLRAVCNMTVGAQLGPTMNVEQAIAQWNRHQSEFFVKYRTMYSTHPHALWRLAELTKAAREMGIEG